MSAALEILPWHQAIWARMQASVQAKRLGHALLFSGPAGVGKRSFASSLTASLLCTQPGDNGRACGSCNACIQRDSGSHPDLIRVQPEEGKKEIGVSVIRALGEKLSLSRHYQSPRVAIIDPADALNTASVNALLKMVEEPPAHTHLIFISERPLRLAPTLRSRCQMTRFGVPDAAQALAWLKTQGVAAQEAEQALADGGGAPLAARYWLEEEPREQSASWRKLLAGVAQGRVLPHKAGAEVGKEHAAEFLLWWQRQLQQQLKGQLQGPADSPKAADALVRIAEETREGRRNLEGNVAPQMVLESIFVLWWRAHRSAVLSAQSTRGNG